MTPTQDQRQRLRSARQTLECAEARKRAARTQPERDDADGVVDRAKRALASVTKELDGERGGGTT